MAQTLAAIVAREAKYRSIAKRELTDAHHALQKPALMEGIHRTYRPLIDGDPVFPDETKLVQVTAREMVDASMGIFAKLFDLTAMRDYTNGPGILDETSPVADVVLPDGIAIVSKAPVPYLLWLERQIEDIKTFVRKIPTLDPATTWTLVDERGVYQSPATETMREIQRLQVLQTAPPTQQHKEQFQTYTDNVAVGVWTSVKFTGHMHPAECAATLQRITLLEEAVAAAIVAANKVEVALIAPGQRVIDYIFRGGGQ